MRKIQGYIQKGKRIFIGLEAAKRNWKLCVRSGKMTVHEATLPARGFIPLTRILHPAECGMKTARVMSLWSVNAPVRRLHGMLKFIWACFDYIWLHIARASP